MHPECKYCGSTPPIGRSGFGYSECAICHYPLCIGCAAYFVRDDALDLDEFLYGDDLSDEELSVYSAFCPDHSTNPPENVRTVKGLLAVWEQAQGKH